MKLRTSRAPQALVLALGCTFAFMATAQVNPTISAPVIPIQSSTAQRPPIAPLPEVPATSTTIGTTAGTAVAPGAIVVTPGVTAIDTSTAATVGSAVTASDRALLDAVVSALSIDPSLRGAKLNVRVSAGTVTLTGTATDAAQAARAQQAATSAAGAARVDADITPVG